MSNVLEAFKSARQRINPEGLLVSGACSYASPAVMIPLEAGLTYAVHELAKDADPNLLKIGVIGALGVANVISVITESKALRSREYSASPVASAINVLTDRPLISSIAGHLVNYAGLSVVNPINLAAIATENNKLLVESAAATSLALTLWFTSMNTLITRGKIQPIVDKMKTTRQLVMKMFNNRSTKAAG